MVRTEALLGCLALLLVAAPRAEAAIRYAHPDAPQTAASCTSSAPCRIDRAVNTAAAGDQVIVLPGTYRVAVQLRPPAGIQLSGHPDHAAPVVIGDADLEGGMLSVRNATVRHLTLQAPASGEPAFSQDGGLAARLRVTSAAGVAAVVAPSRVGTVLRNSVVTSSDPDDEAAALEIPGGDEDQQAGTAELRNVTVMAVSGSATGVRCGIAPGRATLVNALVRGARSDIDGGCAVSFSNFRPLLSPGVALGTGNQSAEPLFADADYRPATGSPTIDAGSSDAPAGSADPDGRPRSLGAAADIGAYEYAPRAWNADAEAGGSGQSSGELPEVLRGVPLPVQGKSVVVGTVRGTVRVRRPGSRRFVALAEPARIPIGPIVDARRGRVQLASAIGDDGRVQHGRFWGSRFKTRQRRSGNGMTTLVLRGGNFAACRSARGAVAAAAGKRKRKAKRSLWARDRGGKFRTHGNDSVATARGTAWVTHDRCDGTLTRVTEGSVAVRELTTGRRVLLAAGDAYLARAGR